MNHLAKIQTVLQSRESLNKNVEPISQDCQVGGNNPACRLPIVTMLV
jgi:hypothetical protein